MTILSSLLQLTLDLRAIHIRYPALGGPSSLLKEPVRPSEGIEAIRRGNRFAPEVYGRPIPIIIGTAPVDGIPVYGTALQIVERTETVTPYTSGAVSSGGGGLAVYNPQPTVIVTYDVKTVVSTGVLLADDRFSVPYQLVQLKVGDDIVFDKQSGINASVNADFYDGTQTEVNTLAEAISGRAFQHRDHISVNLNGYEADTVPAIKTVISDNAAGTQTATSFTWTGTEPDGYWPHTYYQYGGYDPVDETIYQIMPTGTVTGQSETWLVAIDARARTEKYRVPVEFDFNWGNTAGGFMVLPGGAIMAIRARDSGSGDYYLFVIDCVTGRTLAQWLDTEPVRTYWKASDRFGTKFVMVGGNYPGDKLYTAVYDTLTQTLTVESQTLAAHQTMRGRRSVNFTSFFVVVASGSTGKYVYEVRYDGADWNSYYLFTTVGACKGAVYDRGSELLAVVDVAGSLSTVKAIDPGTGSIEFTFDAITGSITSGFANGKAQDYVVRQYAQDGYVFLTKENSDYDEIMIFGMQTRSSGVWADLEGLLPTTVRDAPLVIADQSLGSIFFGDSTIGGTDLTFTDATWKNYPVGSFTPQTVSLQTALTKLYGLRGWSASQLTFEGFAVSEMTDTLLGILIDRDTNIADVAKRLAQFFDFSFCDTGAGLYFRKATRGTDFVPDYVIDSGVVEGQDGAGTVVTADEPDGRVPFRLTFDYISADSGYQRAQKSSVMPGGAYDSASSLRSETITGPFILHDTDAQRLVAERHASMFGMQRTHVFTLPHTYFGLVPGNILQLNLSDETLIVQIRRIVIDTENHLRLAIQATDFVTAVDADTASDSASPLLPASIRGGYATLDLWLDTTLFSDGDEGDGEVLSHYRALAARGQSNWPGAGAWTGLSETALEAVFAQSNTRALLVGVATTALADTSRPFVTDETNTVTIRPINGDWSTFTSITQVAALLHGNLAMLGASGRWEKICPRDITANADGTYTLAGINRGVRHTDMYCGTHAVGDLFVVYNAQAVKRETFAVDDVSDYRYLQAVPFGADPTDFPVTRQSLTAAADKAPPVAVPSAALDGSGGINIDCDLRARIRVLDMFDGDTDPDHFGLYDATLEIVVEDGAGSDLRTLTKADLTSSNTINYTTAQVTADFGSPPATLDLRYTVITHNSRLRGHTNSATVTVAAA